MIKLNMIDKLKENEKQKKKNLAKVVKPKVEKVVKDKVEKIVKTKVEKVLKAKAEKVIKPKIEKVIKPKVEKVVKAKVEKVIKPKIEKVIKPKVEKVVKAKAEKEEEENNNFEDGEYGFEEKKEENLSEIRFYSSEHVIIMPKATALWLKCYTDLTDVQISNFCKLDLLTLESLKYGSMQLHNPIKSNQLTEGEVKRGEEDPSYRLMSSLELKDIIPSATSRKYIPLAYKKKKPEIICWFLNQIPENKHYNEKIIKKIAQILSTTINSIKKNIDLIKHNPNEFKTLVSPVQISICTQKEANDIINT